MNRSIVRRARLAPACSVALAGLVASLLLLGGCDRAGDPRTPGQKLDATIAATERKLERLKGEARVAGQEARATAERIGDRIEAASSDAGITAKIKTRLAADAQLDALKIEVQTDAGRVVLRGTAPNIAARAQATTIAQGVEGVLVVDNQLTIAPPR